MRGPVDFLRPRLQPKSNDESKIYDSRPKASRNRANSARQSLTPSPATVRRTGGKDARTNCLHAADPNESCWWESARC